MLTFTTIRLASFPAPLLLHRQNCGSREAAAPCPVLKPCPGLWELRGQQVCVIYIQEEKLYKIGTSLVEVITGAIFYLKL